MLKLRMRERGVTLIELLIGLTLIGIIMMLAMPSMSTMMQNRQIRSEAEAIRTGAQYARNEALRRNRSVTFAMSSDGGWTVGCNPADTTLVNGEQKCPALILVQAATAGTHNAVFTAKEKQSDGTDAGTAIFTGTLMFTALGRVDSTTLTTGNTADLEITNPTGGACALDGGEMRCLRVTITSVGQVRMCDPAAASGDPRAC